MDHDNNNKSGQFDASLQLPDEGGHKGHVTGKGDGPNPAAELIRKKIEAAYSREPDSVEESEDIEELGKKLRRSKHQEFIYSLTNSGRPLHEIQTAWHEYYAGLTDKDKHQVWQEFYNTQAQTAKHPAMTHAEPAPKPPKAIIKRPAQKAKAKLSQARKRVSQAPAVRKSAASQPLRSLLFGLGVGSMVIIIFMFGFFNERVIAPFIQPSRSVANIPIISSSAVGSNPEIIIPKINVQIPVVYDVTTIDEPAVQKGLERGVVHYADTALPGQNGNVVIVGHSSGNILNKGQYKFAFVLLNRLENGDTFYLQKDGKRYTYQVYKRVIVKPTEVSVLGLADKPATATLITCDPPGTSTNRLVVTAEQISPDPAANIAASTNNQLATKAPIIPSNSVSLWARLAGWFTR